MNAQKRLARNILEQYLRRFHGEIVETHRRGKHLQLLSGRLRRIMFLAAAGSHKRSGGHAVRGP